jgi:hypothetical protein
MKHKLFSILSTAVLMLGFYNNCFGGGPQEQRWQALTKEEAQLKAQSGHVLNDIERLRQLSHSFLPKIFAAQSALQQACSAESSARMDTIQTFMKPQTQQFLLQQAISQAQEQVRLKQQALSKAEAEMQAHKTQEARRRSDLGNIYGRLSVLRVELHLAEICMQKEQEETRRRAAEAAKQAIIAAEKAKLEKEEKEQLMHEASELYSKCDKTSAELELTADQIQKDEKEIISLREGLGKTNSDEDLLSQHSLLDEKDLIEDDSIFGEIKKGLNAENQKIIDDIQNMKRDLKVLLHELCHLKIKAKETNAEKVNLSIKLVGDLNDFEEGSEYKSRLPGDPDHDTLSVISFGSEHSNLTAIQTEIMKNYDSHEDLSRSRSSSQLSRRTDKDDQEIS